MSKCYRFVLLAIVVSLMGCSTAYATVPASVQLLSFDSATFTYVYRVIQGLDATDTLSDVHVQAVTAIGDPYTMTSPAGQYTWSKGRTSWYNPVSGQSGITYKWYRGVVPRGSNLSTPWIGDFTLVIQNTRPVPGIVMTMGAGQIATNHSVNVPGPVPEPSGFVALGSMLLGMAPFARKLRKR